MEEKEHTLDPFTLRQKYTSDLKGLSKQGPYMLLEQGEKVLA